MRTSRSNVQAAATPQLPKYALACESCGALRSAPLFYLMRAGNKARVAAAAAVASCALTLAGAAGAGDRFLTVDGNQPVLVQAFNPEGLYPPAVVTGVDAKAGVDPDLTAAGASIETRDPSFVTGQFCGQRLGRRLVLCLEDNYRLTAQDQLGLLAWLANPALIYTRSQAVVAYLQSVLSLLPGRLSNAQFTSLTLPFCTYTCERIVVIEE